MRYILSKAFSLVLIPVAATVLAHAGAAVDKPDFAFPQKVMSEARADIAKARADKDYVGLFSAMIAYDVAQSSVSNDSLPSLCRAMIAEANVTPQAQVAALMRLYAAQLAADIYSTDRWKFNRRESVYPVPANMKEWSGERFRFFIDSLTACAWQGRGGMPTAELGGVITANDLTRRYYPTQADCMASIISNQLSDFVTKKLCNQVDSEIAAMQRPLSAPWFNLKAERICNEGKDKVKKLLELYNTPGGEISDKLIVLYHLSHCLDTDTDYSSTGLESAVIAAMPAARGTWMEPCLENIITILRHQRGILSYDNGYVTAYKPFTLKVRDRGNIDTVRVAAYRFADEKAFSRYCNGKMALPKASADILVAPGDSLCTMALSPGMYKLYLLPVDGKIQKRSSALSIKSTRYLPTFFKSADRTDVIVADAMTGKPAKGVNVSTQYYAKNKKRSVNAVTDKNGRASFGNIHSDGYITVGQGADAVEFVMSNNYYYGSSTNSTDVISATTSMPVYLPGDSVEYVCVVAGERGVQAGCDITVTVTDPDGEAISKQQGRTDRFGRYADAIKLNPENKNGSYGLSIESKRPGSDKKFRCWKSFEVADFKTDAYILADIIAQPSFTGKREVTISGELRTYSGMGVDGAEVSCTVTSWGDREFSTKANGLSGADGKFSLTAVYPDSISETSLLATVNVIAPDGSALEKSTYFNGKFPLSLSVTPLKADNDGIPSDVINSGQPFRFDAMLTDASGKKYDDALAWMLTADNSSAVKASGKATTGENSVDITKLEPGQYYLKVYPTGRAVADTASVNITVYNPLSTKIPVDGLVWSPRRAIAAKSDSKTIVYQLMAQSDSTGVNLYSTGSDSNDYLGYYCLKAGMNNIPVGRDKLSEKGQLTAVAIKDARQQMLRLDYAFDSREKIKIYVESLRDSVVAGGKETWKIKVVDADGNGQPAAVVADVYNRRLLSVCSPSRFKVEHFVKPAYIGRMAIPYNYGNIVTQLNVPAIRQLNVDVPCIPYWIYSQPDIAILGARGLFSSKMASKKIYGSRANVVGYATAESAKDVVLMAKEESADNLSDTDSAVSNDYAAALGSIKMRGEMTRLAMWCPMLTTEADGTLEIPFAIPADNTSWQFYLTAWNASAECAVVDTTIVANRPLMVSINAPRYLRRGDKARISASLFNNSSKNTAADMRLDVFGSKTDSTPFASAEKHFDMTAGSTCMMDIDVSTLAAGIDADTLYISARAASDLFADGERIPIAIKSSQAEVCESVNFYLTSDDKTYSITAPAAHGSDYSCTLTYSQNPMWTLLQSLESLDPADPVSADMAARAFYSSVIVTKIAAEHPQMQLKRPLSQWKQLRKKAAETLIGLQAENGSMRWGSWSNEGNLWTTAAVLGTLAKLQRSGYADLRQTDLAALVEKAVRYCDSHASSKEDLTFACWRPAFDWIGMSLNAEQAIGATTQYILRDWRKMAVTRKAFAATALQYNNNPNMARTLMSSVSEFGTDRAGKGFEFSNISSLGSYATILSAYGAVEPESPHIDGIRQYLLVRRQGTHWTNDMLTTQIVSSMLNSGTRWSISPKEASVSVNGATVTPTPSDRATGTVTATVPAGSTVTVANPADGPSYGSLTCRYTSEMAEVAPYSNDEITIGKTLLCPSGNTWVELGQTAPPAVGSKVRVRITVTTGQPMNNVVVTDQRPATLQPVNQLSGWTWADGVGAYRENRLADTIFYFGYLPKGTYVFEYDTTTTVAGQFSSGLATAACSLAPSLNAHSGGTLMTVVGR